MNKVIIFFIALFFVGCDNRNRAVEDSYSMVEIISEYEANTIRAANKYQHRFIAINNAYIFQFIELGNNSYINISHYENGNHDRQSRFIKVKYQHHQADKIMNMNVGDSVLAYCFIFENNVEFLDTHGCIIEKAQ